MFENLSNEYKIERLFKSGCFDILGTSTIFNNCESPTAWHFVLLQVLNIYELSAVRAISVHWENEWLCSAKLNLSEQSVFVWHIP